MEREFSEKPIWKLVIGLGVPAMAAQFFNVLYSIVDRIFVGNMAQNSEQALAAIGICAPALTAVAALAYMVGIGGGALMSMSIGRKDYETAKKTTGNALFMLLVISAAVTLAALLFKKPLLYLLGCSDVLYPFADRYFTIYILGTAAVLTGSGMNQFILAQGYARQGMYSVVLGALVNMILDPIFIFGLNMGIGGAAWATLISQICMMLYVLVFLRRKASVVPLEYQGLEVRIMRRMAAIGSISFVTTVTDSLILIFLNMALRKYGGEQGDFMISCGAVLQSFMVLIYSPSQGITAGCSTLFSYHYGRRSYRKVMETFGSVFILCGIYTTFLLIIAQYFSGPFVALFTGNGEMIAGTASFISKYTIGLWGIAVQFAIVDGLTAIGKIKHAFTFSIFRKCIYLMCVWLIPQITNLENIFYCGTIADVVGAAFTAAVFLLFLRKRLAAEMA